MENSTRVTVKIVSIYAVLIGLVVALLYWSIEISGWFYLLAAPAVAFLAMMIYVHSGAYEFINKLKRKGSDKRDVEKEEKRVKALDAFLKEAYLSDGEHHQFPNLIHQTLIDKGLNSEWSWKWTAETELLDALHLNALNLEWFEELESVRYNCLGGAFHGQYVQFFSWGKAVLNFSAGKLDGRQEVICDEKLVLEMTYKGGKLFCVEDKAKPDIQIKTTVVGDVFKYSIKTAVELISFETSEGRPEFARRRLTTKPDDLEFWRYSTPIGKVKITNTRNAESIEIEMGHDSARISNTSGEVASCTLEKKFWSPLAFLYYDFRYVVGRYNQLELVYDNGNRGPPGISEGRKDYPGPLRRYHELFI